MVDAGGGKADQQRAVGDARQYLERRQLLRSLTVVDREVPGEPGQQVESVIPDSLGKNDTLRPGSSDVEVTIPTRLLIFLPAEAERGSPPLRKRGGWWGKQSNNALAYSPHLAPPIRGGKFCAISRPSPVADLTASPDGVAGGGVKKVQVFRAEPQTLPIRVPWRGQLGVDAGDADVGLPMRKGVPCSNPSCPVTIRCSRGPVLAARSRHSAAYCWGSAHR